MIQRLLAGLGAVVMIGGSIMMRETLDSGDGGSQADDRVVIVCASDLETYCDAFGNEVEIRLATAADTAEAIRTGSLPSDIDGWITSSAWLEVLGDTPALGRSEPLATSPIVVAGLADRADALSTLCDGTPIWGCLTESAGLSGTELNVPLPGVLKVGVPSANSALGLPVLASVAAGSLGGVGFASNDFDALFRANLAALVGSSAGDDRHPVITMVTQRGRYAAAGTPQAVLTELPPAEVVVFSTTPAVAATVVLVAFPDGDDLPSTESVREALFAAGWAPAAGPGVEPTLGRGVMSALHNLWLEAIR
ncbi:MAG: hypothetical protein EXQ71_00070 [Acidimicrobiia bacterium]|nr:hypothetical protein [Acidimicrobiia bacterium]